MKTFLFLIIFSFSSFAAQIVNIKGEVFATSNRLVDSILIKKGDELSYNTIISTSKKSIVRLKLKDGSFIILAPESQIILTKLNEDSPTVLHLLIGKLRGHIQKSSKLNNGFKHKFFVKTSSSSIGVRGTEFIAVYNEKNHISGLITLSGNVEIYKKDDKKIFDSIREVDEDYSNLYDSTRELNKDLLSSHRIKIPAGSFSNVMFNETRANDPVFISKKQLRTLKRNYLISNVSKEEFIKHKDNTKVSTQEGIKHGGFVDLNSSLYISPPLEAKLNTLTGLYEMPREYGSVNTMTGDYVPPKGIILDPLKGFTVDPIYYGDRNVLVNLKKLVSLKGPFNKRLESAVRILKNITRTDLYANVDIKNLSKTLETFYGEYKNVSSNPSLLTHSRLLLGTQIYHDKRYLFYLKGALEGLYHNQTNDEVRRNNYFQTMGAFEIHKKTYFHDNLVRLVFDLELNKKYQNRSANENYLPYTSDAHLRVKSIFYLDTRDEFNISFKYKTYNSYEKDKYGKIYKFKGSHKKDIDSLFILLYGASYSYRDNDKGNQIYKIQSIFLNPIKRELLYKSDLSFKFTHEKHLVSSDDPFEDGHMNRLELELDRKLSDFWRVYINLNYESFKAVGDIDERSFNRVISSLGMAMYF